MADTVSAVSVSALNHYFKLWFDSNEKIKSIWVKGEISNFVHHRSGHFYFSLKDEKSVIGAIMFAGSAGKLEFEPEDGMKVLCHCSVTVYEAAGKYQLYVDKMIPDGVGTLFVAYEQLKRKLEAEGLFDASRKKPIPKIPTTVGIITSPTGAAIRDIINICTRRFPLAHLVLYPALVQGEGAPASLIEGMNYFNESRSCDVIIIGRGGGSIEDLWGFNNEELARVVATSRIPVISAVGHEVDFTICDFAADLRAPTPSAGAELCVPDSDELLAKFDNVRSRITADLRNQLSHKKQIVTNMKNRPCLTSPRAYTDDKKQTIDGFSRRMDSAVALLLQKRKSALGQAASKLEALSPLSVLSRGYAYVSGKGEILKSAKAVQVGEKLKIEFNDGYVHADATEVIVKERNHG